MYTYDFVINIRSYYRSLAKRGIKLKAQKMQEGEMTI